MIIGKHKDRDKPHEADYVLATAYETLEAEKCGRCGVPVWWAFSEDSTIEFKMDEHTCHACAHKEADDKKRSKQEPKAGVTRFVKAAPVEGFTELPSRADFQESMVAKAVKEQEAKDKPVVG